MVIAVAGVCVQLDDGGRSVRLALGSVGPTVLRAPRAEAYAATLADSTWTDTDAAARPRLREFGHLAAAARHGRSTTCADPPPTAAMPSAVLARRALAGGLRRARAA